MSEAAFSNDLLPVHMKPQEEELLSSWLFRLSISHGLNIVQFLSRIYGKTTGCNTDLDYTNDRSLLKLLAHKTATALEKVSATTLADYEGRIYITDDARTYRKWVMAVSNRIEGHGPFGLQFCPRCLAEDPIPYFRRHWRLAFIVLCPRHNVTLLDRCQHCGSPVSCLISAEDIPVLDNVLNLTICFRCKNDLRVTKLRSQVYEVNTDEVALHNFLTSVLREGWAEISKDRTVHSYLFFSGLYQMVSVLLNGERAEYIREAAFRQFGIKMSVTDFTANPKSRFEGLAVQKRRAALMLVEPLLKNWPDQFINFCKSNNLQCTILFRHMNYIPFWYWSVVNENLNRYKYCPSDQELNSIRQFIKKKFFRGEEALPSSRKLKVYMQIGVIHRLRKEGFFRRKERPRRCTRCGSTDRQIKQGRTRAGKYRFMCLICKRVYTPEPMHKGYPERVRKKAVRLRKEGKSIKQTARILSVHSQSVINWSKQYGLKT